MNKFWKFLNSPFTVVILGFLLTTWIGAFLTTKFQEESWRRQKHFEMARQDFEWEREKKFEILRRKLDEGQRSLEGISDLINKRYMRLHSVFEAIITKDYQLVNTRWSKYMETVEEWNVKLIINQNKLKRLVNSSVSTEFQNHETDNINVKPISIHGKFFHAHIKVSRLMKCLKSKNCGVDKNTINETNKMLRDLDYHTDAFVDKVSDMFLERATDLENFRAADASHIGI